MASALESTPPVRRGPSSGPASTKRIVFFGKAVGAACAQCGAYDQTSMGHKHCAHVSCPIAMIEFKRRGRKRTSLLERVYAPRYAHGSDEPPKSELEGKA